jgi:tripeptide aminopeptidase
LHANYQGGDITLPAGGAICESEFLVLKDYIGDDIITSQGDTVLGADDKAGIAEIMALAEYLVKNPQIKHGKVGIAFTPDEEIGHGAALFDIEGFGCDFAYTVDGEQLGELGYETFNGASFSLAITGTNIHPGQAKGKMVNVNYIGSQFINSLPADELPETTEGREGFYHVLETHLGVEKGTVKGIIRDHDRAKFEQRKKKVEQLVEVLNKKYGDRVQLTIADQYYNCADAIAPHMHLVENAKNAMLKEGVQPIIEPIRGGTDGSSLSFRGLPCPNICTGGHNAHSTKEFIPVTSMEKVVKILQNIVQSYAQK